MFPGSFFGLETGKQGLQACSVQPSATLQPALDVTERLYYWFFGCAGSSLLCGPFSSCSKSGLLSSCVVRVSHHSGFSRCRTQALGYVGFSSWGAWALEHGNLDALRHMGFSQIRDQTHVSCIGRQILYHRARREAQNILWLDMGCVFFLKKNNNKAFLREG